MLPIILEWIVPMLTRPRRPHVCTLDSYDEFLFAVRGEVNERRGQVILEAFEAMDKDKSGAINAADLKVHIRVRSCSLYNVAIMNFLLARQILTYNIKFLQDVCVE